MSQSLNDWFESVGNWFESLKQNILNFFIQKDEDEREETNVEASSMNNTVNQVDGLVNSKFGAFYTLKDFLVEFWNAIQNSGNVQPDFIITLPDFCGGGSFNALDLSFYNNYRSYIHGIISGICYFVYIKRLFVKIPNIIHN